MVWGSLGALEKRKPETLEIVDRAWTATFDASGNYRAVLSVPEMPLVGGAAKPTDVKSDVSNDKKANDMFVLVSVRNPDTGEYVQINTAEPTFTQFVPFVKDLDSVKAAVVNADLKDIKQYTVKSDGWQLLGLNGKLDRASTTGDIDVGRLLIGVHPTKGTVTTGWAYDMSNAEMAFTMGTEAAGSTASVAFQVGKDVVGGATVGSGGEIGSTTNNEEFGSDPGALGFSKLYVRDGAGLAINNRNAANNYNMEPEADVVRIVSCSGRNDSGNVSGKPKSLTLVTKPIAGDFTFSVPFKAGASNPTPTMKKGWHLLSLSSDTGTSTLAGKGVEAVVWFTQTNGVMRANTWFKDETDIAASVLTKGTTAFMYESRASDTL